LILIPNYTPTA